MPRGFKVGVWILSCVAVVVLLGAFCGYLALRDPKLTAEWILSHEMSRPVTIGEMHLSPGSWTHVELDNLQISNASWGTKSDFIRIGHLETQIKLSSLVSPAQILRATEIDDAQIYLERNNEGDGNWRLGAKPDPNRSRSDAIKASRSILPTALGVNLHNVEIRMKLSSGNELSIFLADMALATQNDADRVSIKVRGRYNGTPVGLDITTQSFQALHKGDTPFHADIQGEAATVAIRLKADMIDPLNFEDVDSRLETRIKQIGRGAALFGGAFDADVPLEFNCHLTRKGDDWVFDDLIGQSGATEFSKSEIDLTEGARRKPDILKGDLVFETADLTPFFAGETKSPKKPEWTLGRLDENVGALVEADLKARQLLTDRGTFDDVSLHASRTMNGIAIENLKTNAFGGRLDATIRAISDGKVSRVSANATLKVASLERLWQAAGIGKDVLRGPFSMGLDLAAEGSTKEDLKKSLDGAVVFSMKDGTASKKAIELAALDLRGIFRHAETATNLKCLLAVVKLRNGTGRLAPFRLVTDDGTILGEGTIDLPGNGIDLSLQADRNTVESGALDKPISISGSLDSPTVRPRLLSEEQLPRAPTETSSDPLPSPLKELASQASCD